jgi:hypothetical protein
MKLRLWHSGGSAHRGPQWGGRRHGDDVAAALGFFGDACAEIIVDWIEGVGPQFLEHATQTLFDAIDGVEKSTPVNPELAAAQSPVGAQQEVVPEDPVFEIVQVPTADQAEISNVIFVPADVGEMGVSASPVIFQADSAHVLLFGRAVAKTRVAGAENAPQDAIAGSVRVLSDNAQPFPLAKRAGVLGEHDGF